MSRPRRSERFGDDEAGGGSVVDWEFVLFFLIYFVFEGVPYGFIECLFKHALSLLSLCVCGLLVCLGVFCG